MQLFTPLNFLGSIYNMVINGLVDLEKLSKILAEKPDVQDKPNAKDLVLPGGPGGAGGAGGGASGNTRGSNKLALTNLADTDHDHGASLGVSVEFRKVYFHYPSQRPSSGLQVRYKRT